MGNWAQLYADLTAQLQAGQALGFWDNAFVGFYQSFVAAGRWRLYLNGLLTTLEATILALLLGVVLLMWAWVNYLRLDGVTIHHLGEEFKDMGKKKKFHSTKSIVDFADERIVSFEELEPEERTYCSMLSNLIRGGALLIIGLIAGTV